MLTDEQAVDSEGAEDTDAEDDFPALKKAKFTENKTTGASTSTGGCNAEESSGEDVEDEPDAPLRINPDFEDDQTEFIASDPEEESGSVVWFKTNCTIKKNFDKIKFEQRFGARETVDTQNFYNIFFRFFNASLGKLIIEQSELYAVQKGYEKVALTLTELNAFIGILIIMGFNPLPNQRYYWSSNSNFRHERIASVMTRKRFITISKTLHLNDNTKMPKIGDPNFDKLFKIRPLLSHFQKSFRDAFDPSRYLSIDESMIPFRGRSSLKHQGFKVWVMCCAVTGYMLSFEFYAGKILTEENLGEKIVTALYRGFEGMNYCLFFDRIFSSFSLIKLLLQKGFYCCTTILPRRIVFPASLLKQDKSLNFGEIDFIASSDMSLVKWKDSGSKAVCVASTMDDPCETVRVIRKNKFGKKEAVNCPASVATYNKYMGGMDVFHHYMANYSIQWKSKIWWMKVFYFFIDAAIVNSYILYKLEMKQSNKKPISYLFFRSQLADELIGDFAGRRMHSRKVMITRKKFGGSRQILVDLSKEHLPIKVDSARRCAYCSTKNKPRRSTLVCKTCDLALCKFPCFNEFHSNN